MSFIGLGSLFGSFKDSPNLLLAHPEYWIFPLQSLVSAAILIYFWKEYTFAPLWPWFIGAIVGLLGLAIWISPQAWLGFPARTDGFNPDVFGESPLLYNLTVLSRFTRLVLIVPLVEELFWRGFVMRYLIKEDFTSVAFGAFTRMSFIVVAVLFMLEHQPVDYVAAIIYALLINTVAVKTRSLFACVVCHAVTNLGLGIYIMRTGQWGFW
ncbi:hypothetical protein BH09VER1_BH09VER1_14300 [soil metagenome]